MPPKKKTAYSPTSEETTKDKIEVLEDAAFKRERKQELLAELQAAKSFDEWYSHPSVFEEGYDESDESCNKTKSLKAVLESFFIFMKEDLERQVLKTKWELDDVEDAQGRDHQRLISQQNKVDELMQFMLRTKMFHYKVKHNKSTMQAAQELKTVFRDAIDELARGMEFLEMEDDKENHKRDLEDRFHKKRDHDV